MHSEEAHSPPPLDRKEIGGIFEGPILPVLVRLALPIFMGMVFQVLYNIVDIIWISRIDLSDPSLVGGVGIVFPIIFLFIAFASGIMVGTSSLVARAVGERNRYVLDRVAESGLIIGLGLAAFILIFGYTFDEKLLRMLGAEGDYFTHGLEYLLFILPAGALMIVAHVFAGILMGEGLMKPVMFAMILSTVGNILLDPLFIFLLGMGVRGAAIATGVAQIIPYLYVLNLFRKRRTIVPVSWRLGNLDRSIIRNIVAVGFPQTAGQITMAVSFIFFNRLVMGIDPLALTAFSICGRWDYVLIVPILAIGSAMLTMIGQNYGRKRYTRVLDIWWVGLFAMVCVMVVLSSALVVLAPLIFPFFSTVDEVVRYAVLQTRIVEFSFIFAGIAVIAQSSFQGIGRPLPGLIITVLRILGIGLPAAYLFALRFNAGMHGVYLGVVTGNVVAAGLALFWVRRVFGACGRDLEADAARPLKSAEEI